MIQEKKEDDLYWDKELLKVYGLFWFDGLKHNQSDSELKKVHKHLKDIWGEELEAEDLNDLNRFQRLFRCKYTYVFIKVI